MDTSLLTKADLARLPKLYENEDVEMEDKMMLVKLVTPWSTWIWYVIEFDGVDQCFGLVKGHVAEFGYFTLKELASISGPFGLKVERAKSFRPTKVGDMSRW